jgi:hypothetical protein
VVDALPEILDINKETTPSVCGRDHCPCTKLLDSNNLTLAEACTTPWTGKQQHACQWLDDHVQPGAVDPCLNVHADTLNVLACHCSSLTAIAATGSALANPTAASGGSAISPKRAESDDLIGFKAPSCSAG